MSQQFTAAGEYKDGRTLPAAQPLCPSCEIRALDAFSGNLLIVYVVAPRISWVVQAPARPLQWTVREYINNKEAEMALRVLAVASQGGHLVQLLRLRPAFQGHDVTFVTTALGVADSEGLSRVEIIPDCNRSKPGQILVCTIKLAIIFLKHRPGVVVTTGAMPGLVSIVVAKLFRAKSIWIDSIANAEELSDSGAVAKKFATLFLTQWPHLANQRGIDYAGGVF